ncbi:acetyltransferase [Vibrio cholerae]|nr:acetyltransferase [Vibrio cholerae]
MIEFCGVRCQPLRRALCAYELKWRDNAAN